MFSAARRVLKIFGSRRIRAQGFGLKWYCCRSLKIATNREKLGSGGAILAENEPNEVVPLRKHHVLLFP